MSHVQPVTHELEADLNWFSHGLSPYWTLGSLLISEYDGDCPWQEVEIDGEPWEVQMYYQKSGIAPRPEDPIDAPRLYEYRIKCRGRGERKVTFHVRPRFAGMEHYESGDHIPSPCDRESMPDEGVNVHVDGSNLDPDEYIPVLRRVCRKLAHAVDEDWNHRYFRARDLHPCSNVSAVERYLRIREGMNDKIVGTSGILQRLQLLLADEKGTQYELKVDNETRVGKHHQLKLLDQSVEMLPTASRGLQLKSYLLKNPESVDEDDPTYHPKLGALFRSTWSRDGAIPWHDLDDVVRDLDETLINLLYWADVPVEPGDHTTFVPDWHFHIDEFDGEPALYDDPTPELEAQQEHLLLRTFQDLTDSDVSALEAMTDGGERHVEEIADETGYATRTIYRALQRLEPLLDSDNGMVRWRSKKLKQSVEAVVERVENVVETGAEQVASILEMDPRQLQEDGSALQRWLNEYAADIDEETDRQVKIKVDAMLSRLRSSSAPYLGTALETLEVAWSRLRDRPFDDVVLEVETVQGSEVIDVNSHLVHRLTETRVPTD